MNGLSIMLWLADIVGKVTMAMWWVFGLTILAIIITNLFIILSRADDGKPFKEFRPVAKKHLYMALIGVFVSTFIPSKETIYLIAGSELGETIITAPENIETMGKVRELVNTKLDEMIATNKGEDGE